MAARFDITRQQVSPVGNLRLNLPLQIPWRADDWKQHGPAILASLPRRKEIFFLEREWFLQQIGAEPPADD